MGAPVLGAPTINPPPQTSLELAVGLLNTWDLLADPPELLSGPDALGRLLRWAHLPTPVSIDVFDVDRVRSARDRLRAALDDAPDAAADQLNALSLELGAVRQLRRAGDAWRFGYAVRGGDPVDMLLGEAAAGLLEAIEDGTWWRLDFCAGDPCRCVFVDRTKNRRRRYCCQLCTNRTMQARYRGRQREASTAEPAG